MWCFMGFGKGRARRARRIFSSHNPGWAQQGPDGSCLATLVLMSFCTLSLHCEWPCTREQPLFAPSNLPCPQQPPAHKPAAPELPSTS
ncbi:hypothetical protein BU23DRAFT_314744 [Bimuria novae-zelandiae CBS 107.79]|uniref:Uncharacterized protein n=1 Tax=Bimuria novae-zelandiae CBS 107.79 TaxID=1447943 RepID=A0A6A5UNY9_9PLEO|nr:hypothetical protein BU23DRAFT_314744 [Bimuria novae-zelandiae CBS 107.79]